MNLLFAIVGAHLKKMTINLLYLSKL